MRLLCFLLFFAVSAECQQLTVDGQHSSVVIAVRNFGLDVRGTIGGVTGSILLDTTRLVSSSFELTAEAKTIDTGISLRDQHLQKREYLDTKNFPTLRFSSTAVTTGASPRELFVTGNLTIKNTTKSIRVPVSISKSVAQPGGVELNGSFTIDRLDYQVGGSSLSLSDEVTVRFTIRALER